METEEQPPLDKRAAKAQARIEKRKEKLAEKLERKQAKLHRKIDCKHQKKLDKLQKRFEKKAEKEQKTKFAKICVVDPNCSSASNEQINKVIKIKNMTDSVWPEACNFTFIDGTEFSPLKSIPVPALEPGTALEITIPMTAPAEDGKYIASYQLVGVSGNPFGKPFRIKLFVGERKKKEKDIPNAEELVQKLVQMGFEDRAINEKWVYRCNGNVEKIAKILANKKERQQHPHERRRR
eukprot:TRINITY_DN4512_c0_g1_i1.p2 TRINITY_DN4512_c0_g1~~TRINITY_DN4512_c0_g1_i1.p2  ORF type:complete len:237 (+),score=103.70 TRINITY_DN4512_c0_g1_i1:190-900(+)